MPSRRPSYDHLNLFTACALGSEMGIPADPLMGSSSDCERFQKSTMPLLDAAAKTVGLDGFLKERILMHRETKLKMSTYGWEIRRPLIGN